MGSVVYFFPGVFTVGNVGLGFYSIVAAMGGAFSTSAWAILLAVVLDVLDGRIARLTRSTSRFGVEFDSLADAISFGVAPAVLMYRLVLKDIRRGILISFLFLLAGVFRLARFNTQSMEKGTVNFDGLPIPVAGGMLASFVVSPLWVRNEQFFLAITPLVMVLLSLLMASKIKYINLKRVRFTRKQSVRALVILLVALLIWLFSTQLISVVFLVYFIGYALSGIVTSVVRFSRSPAYWIREK